MEGEELGGVLLPSFLLFGYYQRIREIAKVDGLGGIRASAECAMT
jgi:hypothetical protein